MMAVQGTFAYRRWFVCTLVVASLTSIVTEVAQAHDRYYVLRDGRKVPLVKSETELAVVFRSHADVTSAKQRLAAKTRCAVEDVAGGPNARVKIIRIPKGGAVSPSELRADEAVKAVHPVYRFAGVNDVVVPTGTMVVKVRDDLTAAERDLLWEEYGIVEAEAFRRLKGVYVVRAAEGIDEILLAEKLAGDERTVWAHPNLRRSIRRHQVAGSDQFIGLQWHLDNTGQTGGLVDADIDAPEAWAITTGEGVLFSMFDDACDVTHEDLRDNYIGTGQDVTVFERDPEYIDPSPKEEGESHGTAVMGLIVAAANDLGVRGVAYGARFTATRGLAAIAFETSIAEAFTFALDQGVDVHNNSWSFTGPNPPVVEQAIETAFQEGRDLDGPGGEPPRGMVIVFSSGNEGTENVPGFALSTLPQVIGVGSSDHKDKRSLFSNYDKQLEFLAPGDAGLVTTDVEDLDPETGNEREEQGMNVAGIFIDPDTGQPRHPDIDPAGKYTGHFNGTSAACPIASGVAGLVLSVNPKLTATDVRIIMEHTCDQVSPEDAQYDGITSRSLKYGYGRINAFRAVTAARETLDNGGFTWPDTPANLRVEGSRLLWEAGAGTVEFLILESSRGFSFVPQDGECYDNQQSGCAGSSVSPIPEGASVVVPLVRCSGTCEPGSEQSMDIQLPSVGKKFFAVYGLSSIGRYSFGASAEANPVPPPAVTINASPLEGDSPLIVQFNGNALSEVAIDEDGVEWDFDIDDPDTPNKNTFAASYKYEVEPGAVRIFTARLTVRDVLGNTGMGEVRIRVTGAEEKDESTAASSSQFRILVGIPGSPGSNVSEGTSPFQVELRIESDAPASVQSVVWDLGDGSPRVTGLAVPHTYVNEGDVNIVLPITATITTLTSGGATVTTTATRLITVLPGETASDQSSPELPGTELFGEGGATSPCGAIGLFPLLFGITVLAFLRRSTF